MKSARKKQNVEPAPALSNRLAPPWGEPLDPLPACVDGAPLAAVLFLNRENEPPFALAILPDPESDNPLRLGLGLIARSCRYRRAGKSGSTPSAWRHGESCGIWADHVAGQNAIRDALLQALRSAGSSPLTAALIDWVERDEIGHFFRAGCALECHEPPCDSNWPGFRESLRESLLSAAGPHCEIFEIPGGAQGLNPLKTPSLLAWRERFALLPQPAPLKSFRRGPL